MDTKFLSLRRKKTLRVNKLKKSLSMTKYDRNTDSSKSPEKKKTIRTKINSNKSCNKIVVTQHDVEIGSKADISEEIHETNMSKTKVTSTSSISLSNCDSETAAPFQNSWRRASFLIPKSISYIDTLFKRPRTASLSRTKTAFKRKPVSRSLACLSTNYISEEVQNEYLASSTLAVPNAVEISKTKQMCIGRKKFNIDPKKGIEYLIENGLLALTPKEIAEFLLKGEGLNKSMIGQYLCEYNNFNQDVLQEFIKQQDFKDLVLLQALRQFLWSFHPVGEYQKIERVLRGFARHYCDVNPTLFTSPEKCFNLAESIILLNTIMHNPSIKKKLTKDMFAEMVNEEGEVSTELLESIYDSIKSDPLKKDDGNDLMHTFFNPDREGWLLKQGGRYKSWKRRWFILTDKCLYYFEYTTDKVPRGIIPLENIKIRDVQDRRMPNCFELFNESSDIVKACKTVSNGKMVEGKHHVYRISAVSSQIKKEWMEAIRKSTLYSPFYDLLSKDKNKVK